MPSRVRIVPGFLENRALQFWRRLFLVCAALLLLGALPALAQTASFTGSAAPLALPGLAPALNAPQAALVDLAGNVYIADTGNHRIVRLPLGGTAATLAIAGLAPGLSAPCGLAMDASGNLYIADSVSGQGRVVVVSPGGAGTVLATGGQTLSAHVKGVAVDASDNVFIADTDGNRIVQVTKAGVASVLALTGLAGPGTLSAPAGLAADPSGKIYIADNGNNRVVVATPGVGAAAVSITGLGTALAAPSSVAVSPSGTLYVADYTNSQVVVVAAAGGAGTMVPAAFPFTAPQGVAVDSLGQLYVADATGGGRVEQVNLRSVAFGHLKLNGGSSLTRTLHFKVQSGVNLGSIVVSTLGAANQDFTVTGTPTLITGAYGTDVGDAILDVVFTPLAPGLRPGALLVTYTAASVTHTLNLPLYGTGDAPLAGVNPAITSAIPNSGVAFSWPAQVAMDGAGNLYVANYNYDTASPNNLLKIPAAGGSAAPVTTLGYTMSGLYGVAIDGGGNLYLSDYLNSKIVKVNPAGIATAFTITVSGSPTGINGPTILALDACNNLYINDYVNHRVLKLQLQDGVTSYTAKVVGTGSFSLIPPNPGQYGSEYSCAVDGSGTLYIADTSHSRILKVTPAGVVSAVATPGLTLSHSRGVGADPMGNLYIADSDNTRIIRVSTAGVATVLPLSGYASPLYANCLTADALGNVLIPDCDSQVVKMNVGGGALAFASTNIGSPTMTPSGNAPPATVTNLGNEDLVFSGKAGFTTHFVEDASDSSLLTASTTLAPGTFGDLAVKFAPQAIGSLSATITVTDNSQNLAGSTQSVLASGTGVLSTPTVQASGLAFSAVGQTQLTASWSRGNGAACAVFIAMTSAGQAAPVSASSYTANPAFGSGSTAGTGWYCVYNGTGTSVTVTGLTAATTYRVFVSEYNTSGGTQAYNTSASTANLTNQATSAIPSFSVSFSTDGTAGATVTGSNSQTILSGGNATAVTAVAPAGYTFLNWTGSCGFATCTSNPLTVTCVTAAQAITAHFAANAIVITTPPDPVLMVASAGGAANTTFTLGTVGSVTNPVTLSASGLPAGVTCSFSSVSVDLSTGPATIGVTLTTAPPLQILGRNPPGGRNPLGFGLGAGAFLACGVLATGRRRKRLGIFLSALLLVLVGGLTACSSRNGGGSGTTSATAPTPAGSYTVVLTASSQGVAEATTSFQLTVH